MAISWKGGCGGKGSAYIAGDGIEITGDTISAIMNASNTYTKTEIDDLIGDLEHVKLIEVDELPTAGETNTIYLVPVEGSANTYQMYIWSDGAWVSLGSTEVDLSAYATKAYVDNLHTGKIIKVERTAWVLDSATNDYECTIQLNAVYDDIPEIFPSGSDVGVAMTSAEQTVYSTITPGKTYVDTTALTLHLFTASAPSTDFYILVKGMA